MVLLDGNKYACETCIKGHRSSTCRHTDRALFEIKKKGRPVTQCDHCRQLRKTKQVHVKCICGGKDYSNAPILPPALKKGHTKIPGSATFPNGLPGATGASIALQASPEALSSDSDNGGCMCKWGGACNCCTPRKSVPRARRSKSASGARPPGADPSADLAAHATTQSSRTPLHILARLAELRPVLPRPSGPSHDLSLGFTHGYHARHHSHENLLFSPYGRAYDLAHQEQAYDRFSNRSAPNILMQDNISMTPTPLRAEERSFRDQLHALEAGAASSPPPDAETMKVDGSATAPFPSLCGCGDSCSCPGCRQHNGAAANESSISAFSSCANPGVCNTCLDCTILSLPASLPPDTSLSIFDAYQADSIDEWIRQVSSLPRDSSGGAPQQLQQQQDAWDNYLTPIAEPPLNTDGTYRVQECCGVLCKCSPETCECDIERGDDCRKDPMFDRAVASGAFNNIRTTVPNGGDEVGDYDGLVRSQSVGAVYPGSGSWDAPNFPTTSNLPVEPTRSRSSSSASSHSSHQFEFSSDSNHFSPNSTPDDFVGQPYASFSLPDLGASLQPSFSPEMRNVMAGASPRSLYDAKNDGGHYPVSNPDSDGYSAEAEAEESMWNCQTSRPWPRTN